MCAQEELDAYSTIYELIDATLHRENVWATSPMFLEMWAAWAHRFQPEGKLKELLIRQTGENPVQALAVTAGLQLRSSEHNQDLSDGSTSQVGGFIHFLPSFTIAESIMATSLLTRFQPWISPALGGVKGYLEGDETAVRWYVTYEHPMYFVAGHRTTKYEREEHFLHRFCIDALLYTGYLPYDTVERGPDPPDFVCTFDSDRLGVECTQFPVQERRGAFALFKRVRHAVLRDVRRSRARFAHLRGLTIYMSFVDDLGDASLPPNSSDDEAVSAIVQALIGFQPNDIGRVDEVDGLPEQAPLLSRGSTPFGCSFHAAPFQSALPDTPFFADTGFELGFGFLSQHDTASAWRQIVDIVHRKDRQENDHLLITVGGPDSDGFSFPSEELVADVALQEVTHSLTTQYLSRVWLHFWSSGRIVQIVPERLEIVPPSNRTNLVPAHRAFVEFRET